MISVSMKFKLLALATKYGVQIRKAVPGEVIVQIATWHQYEEKFLQIINDLQQDGAIKSIMANPRTGVVQVFYDESALEDQTVIRRWLRMLDSYSL